MTIPGLSGDLWPVHLKPFPDELLSSWLIRLAHGHGLKLQSFCALVFGRDKSMWNRDIDKMAPDWLISRLVECTGASLQLVVNTTLKSYEGVLYEHHQPNGNTKWILPLGVYHRARRGRGLQFCPHCLAEDVEPYFRKRWRLALSTVCTEHNCHLLDACPQCESSLAPHRADMRGKEFYPRGSLMAYCWKCGFDLRSASAIGVEDGSSAILQLQLESVLENGYSAWADNPAMHSIVFFEGLRGLIAGITSKQTRERLKRSAGLNGRTLNDYPRTQFELTAQSHRRDIFRVLATVLENWPANFVHLIHECKLRYADLKGDSDQRMFWYEDVIRREAGSGYAAIGSGEANSICDAVIAKHGRFSQGKAKSLSGRDISLHLPDRKVSLVSDDVYEDLLTSIDHQIAGTLDKGKRAGLIRDKIMFACGRMLRLSEGALAKLTIDQIHSIVPETDQLSFVDVARTPGQVRVWVEWYFDMIRPLLLPKTDVDFVFTSVGTRRGFSHSAVGERFNNVVDEAMMRSSIKSYKNWILS